MRNLHSAVALASAVMLATPASISLAQAASANRPNVVFILADNVGYGDMGPYGGGELRGMPTPRTDQLAREGMMLTQFLVEAACTPSRSALMTGRYSIRDGLSLAVAPGTNYLHGNAFTMGQLFHNAGYGTAIFGKWHLGDEPESLPTAHGFDQFYGIPPDGSWDSAAAVPQITMTHTIDAPAGALIDKGPWIMSQVAGGPLKRVKPYTLEERLEIDNELTDRSIAFMKAQHSTGKPFFLYLPFSMGHNPNIPSRQFLGKSRAGDYGDKIMEGDYHVGQVLDALKEMGVENDTIVVFASDNGPTSQDMMGFGRLAAPDMGNSGPFRGAIGDATEGSIRTFCFIRWPGHVPAGSKSYAMFSLMDFLPTFADILGATLPADRPIDGVDQLQALLGKSQQGARESLLTFIGPDLVSIRVKQWRVYFKDLHYTGTQMQQMGGFNVGSANLYYPKIYNIEMDPHEDTALTEAFTWVLDLVFGPIKTYQASVAKYPNLPAPNFTRFSP